MIKLGTNVRAAISNEFLDILRQVSVAYIRGVKAQCDRYPRRKDQLVRDSRMQLAYHTQLLKDQAAFDLEVTHLRGLPFTEFKIVTIPGAVYGSGNSQQTILDATYMVGITKPIECTFGRKYDLGEYRIAIPLNRVGIGEGTSTYHFIPLRDEHASRRFFHHTAHHATEWNAPEHYDAHTCWGNFETVPHIVADRKIFEIFKILQAYLTRGNPGSPLARELPHMREL
jgi:hypothetical protein